MMRDRRIKVLLYTVSVLLATSFQVASVEASTIRESALEDEGLEIAAHHLADETGLDLSTARERTSWEPEFMDLADAAQKFSITRSAGSYIDRYGDGHLALLFTDAVTASEFALQHPDGKNYRTEVVVRSTLDLQNQASGIRRLLEGAGLPVLIVETRPSENRNRVVLGGSTTGDQQRGRLLWKSAFNLLLEEFPDAFLEKDAVLITDEACSTSRRYCTTPLRGGVEFGGTTPATAGNCTLGFRVTGDSGAEYAITAGHCGNVGEIKYTYTPQLNVLTIGPVHRKYTGGDALIIKIASPSVWGPGFSGIFVEGSPATTRNENYEILGLGSSGSLPQNANICKTGATSASTCGPYRGATDAGSNLRRAGYSSCGGDSGGPIFIGHKGYGIHKGAGGRDGDVPCEYDYTGDAYYQLLGAAMTGLNVHLN